MDSLVSKVVSLGIKRIHGNIIIETEGEPARVPGSWPWKTWQIITGLSIIHLIIGDNTYDKFEVGKPGTQTKVVSVVPLLVPE